MTPGELVERLLGELPAEITMSVALSTHYVDGYNDAVRLCYQQMRGALRELEAALAQGGWLPIASAPKGGGAEYVTDPAWVEPPKILLLFPEGLQSVGYWEYYTEEAGWTEPVSGELLALHYGEALGWRALPAPAGGA